MSAQPPGRPPVQLALEGALEGLVADVAAEAASDRSSGQGGNALPPPRPPDASTPASRGPRPSSRLITIVIVLTTLAAGMVGYFLNGANAASSAAAARAQRQGVAASRQLVADQQKADADYLAYVEMRSQQQRATTAFISQALSIGSLSGAIEGARQAAATAAAARSEAAVSADLGPDAPTGPLADPTFPQKLFSSRTIAATELEARQDAENEIAAAWGKIGSDDTAVLTILAVSLFLLGSSVSLRGHPRLIFSGLGTTLVLVGLLWATTAQVRTTAGDGLAAAHHYALGVQAYSNASRPSEYQDAIDEFDQAIALRPHFARAYFGRAQAHVARGNRELGLSLYVSQVDPVDLRASIDDFAAAARYGQSDPTEQNNLGADQLLDWLQSGHGDLSVAAKQFRTAIAADPTSPLSYGNLAVTLLAQQHPDESRATFDQAIAQTLRPTGAKAANSSFVQEQFLGATLSLLDNLGTSPAAAGRAGLAAEIAAQKERLVASLGAGTASTPSGNVTIDRFGPLVVNPASVQVSFQPPSGYGDPTAGGRDLSVEDVAVQWYYRSPTDPRWTVIPAISGWGSSTPARAARSWNVALRWSSGTYYVSLPFLGTDCLPNGTYRAEVYVNGHLGGQTQTESTLLANMTQSRDPATAVGFCHPSDWQRLAAPTLRSPDGAPVTLHGLVTGYSSPTAAVYALRLPLPHDVVSQPVPAGSSETQPHYVAGRAGDYALSLLVAAGAPHVTADLKPAQVLATDSYFMATSATRSQLYTNGTMAAVVTAGSTGDGDELVGVIVGPVADVQTALGGTVNDLARVYYSLTRTS